MAVLGSREVASVACPCCWVVDTSAVPCRMDIASATDPDSSHRCWIRAIHSKVSPLATQQDAAKYSQDDSDLSYYGYAWTHLNCRYPGDPFHPRSDFPGDPMDDCHHFSS